MKYVLLLVSLLFSTIVYSQTADSILVSREFIIESAKRMQEYQNRDAMNSQKISTLNLQITKLEQLNANTESILNIRENELEMYRGLAKRFIDIPPIREEKWHESRTFNFIAGVVVGGIVIYSGAYIVSKIR